MVGATQSRIMRNSMLLATTAYFGLFYSLEPAIGNNALWLAFTSFMALRGVFQYFMSRRLQTIYAQAEK
jgi:MATE family multidrug resistance protein